MGIGSTGYVLRLVPLVSEDSTGRNLQLVVPFDTPLKLAEVRHGTPDFGDFHDLAVRKWLIGKRRGFENAM